MKLTTASPVLDLRAVPVNEIGGDLTATVRAFTDATRLTLATGQPAAVASQIAHGERLLATIPSAHTDTRQIVLNALRDLRAA